jgi:hypothetical protein
MSSQDPAQGQHPDDLTTACRRRPESPLGGRPDDLLVRPGMALEGRLEPLAGVEGNRLVSADCEWLHGVVKGPSPERPATAR